MRDLWTEYELFAMYGTRGEKAKRSRWFQSCQRWRELREDASHILLSVLYLGLSSDWWPDLASSPWRLREQRPEEAWIDSKKIKITDFADNKFQTTSSAFLICFQFERRVLLKDVLFWRR
eukprot:165404-Amphidinium_carterae.1